ncbi:MAG: class 1 fructose-1,6-bisphosphatase [Dehalococcoidia bacterium]|tara:strand:+ start:552 stop:1508 length:957 start_codon:yes stop_codon:yes gene_type:complete
MIKNNEELNSYLTNQNLNEDLILVLKTISDSCFEISETIRSSGINNLIGKTGEINVQGEKVEKLDEYANNLLIRNLSHTGKVFLMGSEEIESAIIPNPNNIDSEYVVVFDPLDGSSNIDVSVTIGTIFAIYKKINNDQNDLENLLQKGKNAIVAGYTVYGSSTVMCLSSSVDTSLFSFDKNGRALRTHSNIKHGNSNIYSVNESNWNNFTEKDKSWIKKLKSGTEGEYTARYVGSLVSDFHRNLIKGGVFAYPYDSITGEGRLRLIYECNPLSFIANNTNGDASDGERKILEIKPSNLHQRVGFYVGSKKEMEIRKKS